MSARAGGYALCAVVACAPRSSVTARFEPRATERLALRSPAGDAVARFVVVSRGVRYARVHDGFGCVSGEVPGVDVIPAQHGERWEAHLHLRVEGRAAFGDDPEGMRVQLPRGGSTGMRSREAAEQAARDGEVQACWSADGSRLAFRTHHPHAMGANTWSRVEWSPAARVVRYVGVAPDCARALTAPPAL